MGGVIATFTSVDGAAVEIGGSGLPVRQEGATMFAVWEGELGRYEFTVGRSSLGELQGAEEGVQLTEEYSLLAGGRLRTGSQTTTDPETKAVMTRVLGVWLGSNFSVHLWVSDQDSPATVTTLNTQILSIFNQFKFTETPTGVVISSPDPKRFALVRDGANAPSVARYVHGVGLIEAFQRTPEQERQIPAAAGAPVRGGELWLEANGPAEDDNDAILGFFLAGDTAIAHILGETSIRGQRSDPEEEQLLDRCSRLTIDWKAGQALQ